MALRYHWRRERTERKALKEVADRPRRDGEGGTAGNEDKGEREKSSCQAKCYNHPPPGRKVLGMKLSQVSGALRGG